MYKIFYILLISLFFNIPFTLQANGSSDDEEKEFFSLEEEIYFSPCEDSDADNESNKSVIIYSSDSEIENEDEMKEEDLSQDSSYIINYNKKITNFLQQAKKLNDIFTTKSNHEKLDADFPKYYYEADNRFNLFSNYFNVYPYSI
jgi:hypothetical protein